MASSWESTPCPICFEATNDHWCTRKVRYYAEGNHSWTNRTCSGHDICWSCLAKHVAIQVLSEGKSSIRCPGPQCNYHLLQKDVEYAMWGSSDCDEVVETLARLRSQSCQERLKQMVLAPHSSASEEWLLGECQPCPRCFVCCRRETGCNHIVCRCGGDFCFGCGTPCDEACLCDSLAPGCRQGNVFFAAWLRSSSQSPCEWLADSDSTAAAEAAAMRENGRPSDFMPTIGFWLWAAGAEIPVVWEDPNTVQFSGHITNLKPLQWKNSTLHDHHREDVYEDRDDHDELWESKYDGQISVGSFPYLSGHLRKEAYSHQTQRTLRRGTQGRLPKTASKPLMEQGCCGIPKANRTLY